MKLWREAYCVATCFSFACRNNTRGRSRVQLHSSTVLSVRSQRRRQMEILLRISHLCKGLLTECQRIDDETRMKLQLQCRGYYPNTKIPVDG